MRMGQQVLEDGSEVAYIKSPDGTKTRCWLAGRADDPRNNRQLGAPSTGRPTRRWAQELKQKYGSDFAPTDGRQFDNDAGGGEDVVDEYAQQEDFLNRWRE